MIHDLLQLSSPADAVRTLGGFLVLAVLLAVVVAYVHAAVRNVLEAGGEVVTSLRHRRTHRNNLAWYGRCDQHAFSWSGGFDD